MANLKASIKSIRKTAKNRARNLAVKSNLKRLMKAADKLISAKSKEALESVKKIISAIDKAVENGRMHKNTAARKKSRLMARFNAIAKK